MKTSRWKWSRCPSGDKIAFALLGNSVEVATYTPDWFIRAIEKGATDLKIVLGGSNVPHYSLLVPNEVQSYADLKASPCRHVSTIKAADTYLTKKMFAANGLKDTDIIIQAGSRSGAGEAALRSVRCPRR